MKWDRIVALVLITTGVAYGSYCLVHYFLKLQNSGTVISANSMVAVSKRLSKQKVPIIVPKDERPHTGEHFADLIIPRLHVKIPVVEGTNEDQLSVGAGHFAGSVLPGEDDNCVISGHRDTVFRRFGELKHGDLIMISTRQGTFSYRIDKTWITVPSDRTVIVSHDSPILTLTTCYPFFYIGPAPKRYIIQANLVK